MPREQLKALVADVDRLLSAGGTLAAQDESLRRRGQTLRELGKKVPVLAQIADSVDAVTGSAAGQTSPRLLDLLLVVKQVRASLSTAGAEGTLQEIEPSGPWFTPLSAHDCYALADSLSQSGTGRLGLFQEVIKRESVADLRLLEPLIKSLKVGSYPEWAELLSDEILPAFGNAVLPELCRNWDAFGKADDARRLEAIHKIDPEKGIALCRQAIQDGSTPVRAQALRCLARSHPDEAEKVALEILSGKANAELRAAAIMALGASKGDDALNVLLKAFCENEASSPLHHHLLCSALAASPHPDATNRILKTLETLLSSVPAKGKKAQASKGLKVVSQATPARELALYLLRSVGQRKDSAATKFLVALLENSDLDVAGAAMEALGDIGPEARPAVKPILKALENEKTRKNTLLHAILVLPKIAVDDETVLSTFIAFLQDANSEIRQLATAGLGELRNSTSTVVKALLAALEDKERNVRSAALRSLQKLRASGPEVLAGLAKASKDKDPMVCHTAGKLLESLQSTP